MNHTRYSLMMLFLLTACNHAAEDMPATGNPVCLDLHLGGISMEGRSTLTDDNGLNGKKTGIYAINSQKGESSYGTAPQGTPATYLVTHSSSIAAADGKALWLNNQSATIYAAYPVGETNEIVPGSSVADAPLLPVSSNAITWSQTFNHAPVSGSPAYYDLTTAEYDYMYGVNYTNTFTAAQPTASNAAPSVTIGFRHALAQLYIKVKKDAAYPGPGILASISCTFGNIPALKAGNASRMSLKDGKILETAPAGSHSYSYTVSAAGGAAVPTDGLEFRNYTLPATGAVLSAVTVNIDGKATTLTPSHNSTDWAAGNIYRYTFTVKGAGLSISSFEVVDWTTGKELGNVTIQ